ncbi:MAG: peroxiredoxin [Steroidobacteraceae bacterium]
MLRPGSRAPDFTLPDQDGRPVSLSGLLHGSGSGSGLVLYFYPADFTPGCTREACSIRDMYPDIERAGLTVVGVSPQPPQTHTAFRDKHGLPFTLLADVGRSVVRLYGVTGPFGLGIRRATFAIDSTGIIRDAVRADFRIGRHEAFIREAVASGRSAR